MMNNNSQIPSHYKIVNNNNATPELPTQSKLVEIPHMDKSFMMQKQRQFERETQAKNTKGLTKIQNIQTKTQPENK